SRRAPMRQPRPPLFAPLRRLGDARACCLSRPVLGTTPVQGFPWLPRSLSELAECPCGAHHSCSSSVGTALLMSRHSAAATTPHAPPARSPCSPRLGGWARPPPPAPPPAPGPSVFNPPTPDEGRGHTRSPQNRPDFGYSSRRWAGVGTGTLENA